MSAVRRSRPASSSSMRRRGMSLAVVLAVVALMAVIGATMAAVSTMSLNYTQRWTQATVALDEAEAGVAELLYSVADNPAFGKDGTAELRSRLTAGYDDRECGHVVTFRKDGDFAWSVNNLDGTTPEGYGGRTVPSKMVHAWSIGYCRGVTRTVEVLIEKPPFPYALAASGHIRSKNPLDVQGVRSAADMAAGKKPRPGHVCANSPENDARDPSRNAIYVRGGGSGSDAATFISGFAQSVGGIRIEDGVVVGGVRPRSTRVTLPEIDIAGFRMAGAEGVIAMGETEWPAPKNGEGFVLDALYDREGDLVLNGPVRLRNAFLFVNGNLTVRGSLTGTGAVLVTGNVTVQGDAAVSADHRVALLAGGRVTLTGRGNHFQGVVYAKRGVTASRITVLGALIVAGGTSDDAVLDSVKVVSLPDTTGLSFVARSSRKVSGEVADPRGNFPFPIGSTRHTIDPVTGEEVLDHYTPYIGLPGEGDEAPPSGAYGDLLGWSAARGEFTRENVLDMLTRNPTDERGRVTDFRLGGLPDVPGGEPVKAAAQAAEAAAKVWQNLESQIKALNDVIGGLRGESLLTAQRTLADLQTQQTEARRKFDAAISAFADALIEYATSRPNCDLSLNDGNHKIDLDIHLRFDLNDFLNDGARLRIPYWRVSSERP